MNKDQRAYLKRLKEGFHYDTSGAHIAILDPRGTRVATVGKNSTGPALRNDIALLRRLGVITDPSDTKKVVRSRMPAKGQTLLSEEEKQLVSTTVSVAGSMRGFARHAIEIAKENPDTLRTPASDNSFAMSVQNALSDKGITGWVKDLILATATDISEPPPALDGAEEAPPVQEPSRPGKSPETRIDELVAELAKTEDEIEGLERGLNESRQREEARRQEAIRAQQEARQFKLQMDERDKILEERDATIRELEQRLATPSAVNRDALRRFVVSARKGNIDQEALVELAFSLLED